MSTKVKNALATAVAAGHLGREDLDAELDGLDLSATDQQDGSRISAGRVRRWEVADTLRERFGIPARKLGSGVVKRPRDLAELVDCVQDALNANRPVRMVGAARAHSLASHPGDTDCVSSERLGRIFGGVGRDIRGLTLRIGVLASGLARVQAGATVRKVLWKLRGQERALTNHGSGDFQSVVGAISTGTHGSAHWCPSLAGLVRAMVVVRVEMTGSGPRPRVELIQRSVGASAQAPVYAAPASGRWTSKNGVVVHAVFDDDAFDAHVVGMGCLGLVYSVTLDVIPMIHLREWREPTLLAEVLAGLPALFNTHRHLELVVDPYPRAGSGPVAGRKQVTSTFDVSRLRCQVIRRKETTDPIQGVRPPAMDFGALPVSSAIVGSRIREVLQDPVAVGPQGAHAMVSCASITGASGYVDLLPEALLLNLKYKGLGAEWAVPHAKLKQAIEVLLREGWGHHLAYRDGRGWRGSSEVQTTALVRLLEAHTPFYNGPSVRWVKGEGALLAGTHRRDGRDAEVALWACIEVGFLGAPKLERLLIERKRHFGLPPDERVPDSLVPRLCQKLRKRDAARPRAANLEKPKNHPAIKKASLRRMLRIYAAYERGRTKTLKGMQDALLPLGARPHQGLWSDFTWRDVRRSWGTAADVWRARYLKTNPVGTFDAPLTRHWGIRP